MPTVDVEGDDAADGLVALVVAVVELLVEAMEREALRRMESGSLTDEEVERVGAQLASLEDEVEGMKETHGVEREVASLRDDLSGLVDGAVRQADRVTDREANR